MRRQMQGPQADNVRKKNRSFPLRHRIITSSVSLAIVGIAITSFLILRSQGASQGLISLTIISIIVSMIVGMLTLMINFFQWLSSIPPTEQFPPTTSPHTRHTEHVQQFPTQTATSSLSTVTFSPASTTEPLQDQAYEGEVAMLTNHKTPSIDWSEMPRIGNMYGRNQERAKLEQWIVVEHYQVVALLGMGGIGKTTLATVSVEQMKDKFDYVFWCSLRNAPPIENILKNCIHFLSHQQQIELPTDVDGKISLLLEYLQNHRCLVVLDNFESVLQAGSHAGQYRNGYEGYGKLIRNIDERRHQSCLFLTSREKPKELVQLEGFSSLTRSLKLLGVEQAEGQSILKDQNLFGTDEIWTNLINLYSGNPLALKLVSASIRDMFGGNIAEFLKQEESVFGDIHDLLNQQFHRLSDQEREILCWLAIERELVSLDDLQEDIVRLTSKGTLIEIVASLQRRSIIEISGTGRFTLQPVIMEYVTNQFVEKAYEEINMETFGVFGSHALIKAKAKDYVRHSQVRLILDPLLQRLLSTFGKEETEKKLKSYISLLRQSHPPQSEYVAGNILNLLLQLKADLTDYDFSNLIVRQAYLQGATLPKVNFAHSNLATSVFTNTFGCILSVAVSPNGEFLAAGTANGEVQLWQVISGRQVFNCHGHIDWVTSVAFSTDGTLLASGSDDHTIRLWEVGTGQCLKTLRGHNSRVRSVAFSPRESILVSGSEDHTLQLWDIHRGQSLRVLRGHDSWVRSVAFSPDGKIIASGSDDQTIRLWEVGTGQCVHILHRHTNKVYAVAFSPNSDMIASSSHDQTVRLWDVKTGQCLRTLLGHTKRIYTITFSPDGKIIASGSDDQTIRLWEVSTGQCLNALMGHTNRVCSVAFSPNGIFLASGSEDQTIRIWEVVAGQCLNTLQGYTNQIYTITFSPDGKIIASGSDDQTIRLWEVSTGQYIHILYGHSGRVRSVAFSSDGTFVASGSEDQSIRIWEVSTGLCSRTLRGHNSWVRSAAFGPNSILVSSSEDSIIRIWDVKMGQCLRTLLGHDNWIYTVAFSPDGKIIASGSEDQTIRLWEVSTGQCLHTLHGHTNRVCAVVFNLSGNMIASGSHDQTVRLWDVKTGQCLRTLLGHGNWIYTVAFSPDGKIIASGSEDQTIRLWEVSTGQCLHTLHGHTNRVFAVAFNPNGNVIASGSHDGTIKLWIENTGQCLKTLKSNRPYEGMNIIEVRGLTDAQKATLRMLGAVENKEQKQLPRDVH